MTSLGVTSAWKVDSFYKTTFNEKECYIVYVGRVFKHMVSISAAKMANTCSTFQKTFLTLITPCKKRAARVCFVLFISFLFYSSGYVGELKLFHEEC